MDPTHTNANLPPEPLLRVDRIKKRFGGIIALKDFSLVLEPGRIVVLLGPNGAGKTTLIDIVSGRHVPDSGEVVFASRRINGRSPQWIGRRGLVRTFQDGAAPAAISVTDYLTLAQPAGHFDGVLANVLRPLAARRHQDQLRRRARSLLARYDLASYADRPCGEMSVGEWKFLTLLRAFDRRPRVLLLDEPSSALSPQRKESLVELSKQFTASDGAILLVSHDMDFTRAVADEITYIEGGENRTIPSPDIAENAVVDPVQEQRRQYPPDAVNLARVIDVHDVHGNTRALPFAAKSRPTLSVRDLNAEVGGRPVLRGISFDLWDGEILGVVGSNGAGKSTLLKSLLGLTPPTCGSVTLAGRLLTGLPPHRIARAGLGLALQGARISPRLTVEEAVSMAWARGNPEGSIDRAKSPAWETLTDCSSIINRMPLLHVRRNVRAGMLSGGEQQLLAVAMAMAHRPAVLMLDEPSVGLQRKVLRDLFNWVRELSELGLPFIIIEQDVASLRSVATRVANVVDGCIVEDGHPKVVEAHISAETLPIH